MSSVEVLETPVKSENDKKSYRVIRLENGLKALLISVPSKQITPSPDPSASDGKKNETAIADEDQVTDLDSKLAACAVCVDVGAFSDPSDVQGMAHFLGMTHEFSTNDIFINDSLHFRAFDFSGLREISKRKWI